MFNSKQKIDFVFITCLSLWTLTNFLCMALSSPYCSFNKYLIGWSLALLSTLTVSVFLKVKQIKNLASFLWLVHICMIAYLVFATGKVRGSKRWIYFFNLSYQPSEGLKLFYILLFSHYLIKEKYWLCAGLFCATSGLLVMQPDLGNALIVLILTLILMMKHGVRKLVIVVCVMLSITSGLLVISYFPHARERYTTYLSADKTSNTSNKSAYQNLRALASIKTGGLTGVGPGKGTIKRVLPDAYSDFIFAVIGEELGALGCLLICFSFLIFYMRALYYADLVPGCRESLWLVGISSLIALQAWIHMGSSVWLIPTKGTGLPFISHGGSSMLILHIAFGVVLISARSIRKRLAIY